MYKIIIALIVLFSFKSNAQITCEQMLKYVKSEDVGITYYSYNSDAISYVSFHKINGDNYETYYFAIVKFESSYQEYIYQVGSNSQFSYSLEYDDSAGEAFYKYINPYSNVLGCSPNL